MNEMTHQATDQATNIQRPAAEDFSHCKDGFERQGRKPLFLALISLAAEDLCRPPTHDDHIGARQWLDTPGYGREWFSFELTCDMLDMTDSNRTKLRASLMENPQKIARILRHLNRDQNLDRLIDVASGRFDTTDFADKTSPAYFDFSPESRGEEAAAEREAETSAETEASVMGMTAS